MPTHLSVEDKLVSLGGIDLTLRQSFILITGGSLAFDLWKHLDMFASYGVTGGGIRLLLGLIPAFIALIVAFMKVGDRPFESWLAVVLYYRLQPKTYIWRPLSPAESGSEPRREPRRRHVMTKGSARHPEDEDEESEYDQ